MLRTATSRFHARVLPGTSFTGLNGGGVGIGAATPRRPDVVERSKGDRDASATAGEPEG